MTKLNSKSTRRHAPPKSAPEELDIIRQDFAAHLRSLGYARLTIVWYQKELADAIVRLARRGRRLFDLRFDEVPDLLRSQRAPQSPKMLRAALHAFLRFRNAPKPSSPASVPKWRQWLERYDHFMATDCALAANTRIYRHRYARCFPGQLANAVPRVSNYGRRQPRDVFSEKQRRMFLAVFNRADPRGLRDYAMALCMLDLGLRAQEVVRLRLQDVSWNPHCLNVPATKTGRSRQLPLPSHIAVTLRAYMRRARPAAGLSDFLFLRHRNLAGRPFSLSGLRQAMRRAARGAGLPTGTHRLRHSFAARLYARGADLKQIADVLGHQYLDTSNRYVHPGAQDLMALAQPWPA